MAVAIPVRCASRWAWVERASCASSFHLLHSHELLIESAGLEDIVIAGHWMGGLMRVLGPIALVAVTV